MFASQAHSFRQQARLSITLSWIAGYTNILTLLACGHGSSHMSGTASQLGRDVAEGKWRLAAFAGALLGCFVLGSMLSGALTEWGKHRRWASIYVLPMAVEAALLAAFALILHRHSPQSPDGGALEVWSTLLPAMAMGLQNATITRISGGVVRTTHVTGVLTDFGMESALWWLRRWWGPASVRADRGGFASSERLLLLASILGSFAAGAALGTLAFHISPAWCMLPAVLFLGWIVAVDLMNPIARVSIHSALAADLRSILPDPIAVYHISRPGERRGRKARMPNLVAWADELDPSVRVAVLDLASSDGLDGNAVIEIRVVAERFAATGRSLVLAGVTPRCYASLRAGGVLAAIPATNICTDLDFAAARAIALLHEAERAGA